MIKANQEKAKIDIETVSKYAKIKLADFDEIENILSTEVDCDLEENEIILPFTITAPDGETKQNYTIKLVRGSNDTSVIVTANEETLTKVDNKYEYSTLDTTEKIVINATLTGTANYGDIAGTVDINQTGLNEVTIIVADIENKTLTIPMKVTAEDGTEDESEIIITIISTDASQKSIVVNDGNIERIPETTGINEYTTGIKYLTNEVEVVITANDEDATIKYNGASGVGTLTFNVDITGDSTEILYEIQAQDGSSKTEHKLIVNRMSNNTGVLSVKINDEVIDVSESDVINMTVKGSVKNVIVEVEKAEEEQTIRINNDETTEKTISMPNATLTITIDIIAEDGTTETKIINLEKTATISGKVITENVNGIHKATVKAYKSNDMTTPVAILPETEDDGSYEIEVYIPGINSISDLNDEYTVVVSREGYLAHTITNIRIEEHTNTDVQEVYIKAGDIDGNGEIELDDLTVLNDHIGEAVTDANRLYDLNGDGAIDNKDRTLLKRNYHSKLQQVKWVNPNGTTLVKPLDDGYTITSSYGSRVDPIDGSTSFHSGIDLCGPHHGNIYAIADGEVTWAGVQSSYGNCVEIKHVVNGETIYSFYAHMSRIDVAVGDTVTQGSVIGLEGGDQEQDPNPGRTTGHHLHFEIRKASGYGNDVDPGMYLDL
jgi:murein DD-endopeptidase MepM/ murein hydrolase activator NlpD